MNINTILASIDHTLLSTTATWNEIKTVCDDGMKYKVASVCIPPCYVKQAKEYVKNKVKICTVIGFPHGYNTTAVKVFEARDAVANGADEIEMVINLGWLKDGKYDLIKEEIISIKAIIRDHILKVIIETCLLNEAEKIKMCRIVTEAGAEFVKTSTGFSKSGATFADVELLARNVGPGVKIKASGGIHSLEDAEKFIGLGTERLGTSKIIKFFAS